MKQRALILAALAVALAACGDDGGCPDGTYEARDQCWKFSKSPVMFWAEMEDDDDRSHSLITIWCQENGRGYIEFGYRTVQGTCSTETFNGSSSDTSTFSGDFCPGITTTDTRTATASWTEESITGSLTYSYQYPSKDDNGRCTVETSIGTTKIVSGERVSMYLAAMR